MASFASQLKDMFFGLVERVTGYGASRAEADRVSRTEERVPVVQPHEIRPRSSVDPPVSGGSQVPVN
uniref:Uncharacterized protein n=1 Tax=Setaria viridis TaxID=4556 RepID=A0A4U6U085_SETVI|nr:hypothetical protein SEVIR_7G268500v2 [Setaria viridis]